MADFSARPISVDELPRWDELVSRQGSVFQTSRWTALFPAATERIGIYKKDQLVGGFVLYKTSKFGLQIIKNPPFTPELGPFYQVNSLNNSERNSEIRNIIKCFRDYLLKEKAAIILLGLSPDLPDLLPFKWLDFKVIPHYTYKLNLGMESERLSAGLAKDRRNSIKRAQKDGVEIKPVENIDDIIPVLEATYNRQTRDMPLEQMKHLARTIGIGAQSYGFQAVENGQVTAATYVVHDQRCAYYLLGGYSKAAHFGAGASCLWQSIAEARKLGLATFDFEGSSIPAIEHYFREFGGQITPVFGVYKAWLPLEIALKFYRRSIF